MTTDARAAAWLTAWDCLIEADSCRKAIYSPKARSEAHKIAYREAMADLQRNAELFTALVNAPAEVGLAVGVELERRRDAETIRRTEANKLREYLNDLKEQQ